MLVEEHLKKIPEAATTKISHWDYELDIVYREIKKKGKKNKRKKNENGSEEWTIEFSEKEMGFIYRD